MIVETPKERDALLKLALAALQRLKRKGIVKIVGLVSDSAFKLVVVGGKSKSGGYVNIARLLNDKIKL